MMARFIGTIFGASALLALIFGADVPKPVEQNPFEVCQEVERELFLAAEQGNITEAQAIQSAERCFELYAGVQRP